jgi:hypothetical protein
VYDKNAIAVIDLANDCRPAPPGLNSWWAGDGNANDMRSANHGVAGKGVSFVPGVAGQAFSFDGTASLRVSKLANNFANEARLFTLAGWIRVSRNGKASPVFEISDRATGKPLWRMELRADDSLAFCEWNVGKVCTVPAGGELHTLEPGVWYHFAAVHDDREIALVVNGRAAGAAPTHPRVFGERWFSANFGGDSEPNSFFAGSLDELQLYNRPLTGSEIEGLYQSRQFGSCYRSK